MRRITLSLAVLLAFVTGCKMNKKVAAEASEPVAETVAAPETDQPTEQIIEEMEYEPKFDIRTNKGIMVIKLYEETPLHKDNFVKLAKSGFYDSVLFHRVINGFMIQAGDPLSKDLDKTDEWGTGGPGYTIPAEIIPGFTHKKGALAAARRGDFVNPAKASSGSQFYIVQDANACKQLDGEYTIFGEVIEGLDIIDKIAGVETDCYDRPLDPVVISAIVPHSGK